MSEKQLIVAVEGTAAMGPYWQSIVSDYLEKIIRSAYFHHFSQFLYFLALLKLRFQFSRKFYRYIVQFTDSLLTRFRFYLFIFHQFGDIEPLACYSNYIPFVRHNRLIDYRLNANAKCCACSENQNRVTLPPQQFTQQRQL